MTIEEKTGEVREAVPVVIELQRVSEFHRNDDRE